MRDHDLFLKRALLDEGAATHDAIVAAERHAVEHGCDLTDALRATDAVPGRTIALVKAAMCEVPFVDLSDFEPCVANASLIPRALADRYRLFPLFHLDGVLTVAMDDPLNLEAADQVRQTARCEVDPVLADRELLGALIARAYSLHQAPGSSADRRDQSYDLEVDGPSSPAVAAVSHLLIDAIDRRASDVHLNPDEHEMHVRYRIDGVLQVQQGPPLSMHAAIVQRLKVMSHLDLTQTRRPQDGKFRLRHGDRTVDVRLSTIPTVCGENVVMRLLNGAQTAQDFRELGMPPTLATETEQLITRPWGMLLATGPTGSGKTTTLYTAVSKLNTPDRNIMTIEDPVEIRLPMVRQVQVHHEIGLTFASALRSILRQDPDVVLVGEIRDAETGGIALQAALTGHLVLSTLHTNDAASAVARLRDLDLPPFLINSGLLGVIAQRLVRRICAHCMDCDQADAVLLHRFGLHDASGFFRGAGCGRCGQTGYRGRLGVYELLTCTDPLRALIDARAGTDRIRQQAIADGMRPMWRDGLDKARLRQTSLEEISRVVMVDAVSESDGGTPPRRMVA